MLSTSRLNGYCNSEGVQSYPLESGLSSLETTPARSTVSSLAVTPSTSKQEGRQGFQPRDLAGLLDSEWSNTSSQTATSPIGHQQQQPQQAAEPQLESPTLGVASAFSSMAAKAPAQVPFQARCGSFFARRIPKIGLQSSATKARESENLRIPCTKVESRPTCANSYKGISWF